MNRKTLILLLAVVFCPFNVFSGKNQDSLSRYSLCLTPGLRTLSSIDELYSFNRYSGSAFQISGEFLYQKNKTIHRINAGYSKIRREPDIDFPEYNFSARYRELISQLADFDYSCMYRIYSKKIDFYISGNFINSYHEPVDTDPELFFSSLAPGIRIANKNQVHKFSLEAAFPVVSLAIRNNYYINLPQTYEDRNGFDFVKENLRFRWFNTFFVLYTRAGYEFNFSDRFGLSLGYGFRLIHDREPRLLRSVSGIYTTGLIYKF